MSTQVMPTFCRVCEPSCGLLAEVNDGVLTGLKPDKAHPVSKGFACHKGVGFGAIHHDPDRLTVPLWSPAARREKKTHRAPPNTPVTWGAALDDIAKHITRIQQQYGKEAVALYVGNPTAFNTLGSQAIGTLAASLGTRRLFSSGTQDCANKFAGSELVYGTSTLHPVPDISRTQCLFIFGENPKISHMSFMSIANPMHSIKQIKKKGGVVRYINPRKIESVASEEESVRIKPDTDLYLLAALLNEIDALGQFDEQVIADHGKHIEGLRAFIAPYTPVTVAGVVGLTTEAIRALALTFSSAESAAIHMSTGVNMGRQGTLCYWLVQMLSFVTGNLDKPGGNRYASGFYPATKSGRLAQKDVFFSSEFGELRYVRGMLPANLLADMIGSDESPIKALIVIAGNPILSVAGETELRQAFGALDLLVSIDLYQNATGMLADYMLPACDMLERSDINICGLGMQHESHVQFTDAIVAPKGERKEEWWIANEIVRRVKGEGFISQDDPYGRTKRMLSASGISFESIKASPSNTVMLPQQSPGNFFREWIQTEDRRVDCCPKALQEACKQAHEIYQALVEESPHQMKLISLRTNYMQNSWFHNVSKLKRGRHLDNPIHMSSEDAEKRMLVDGDWVQVATAYGQLKTCVHIDDTLRPGAVAMTHGWGNAHTYGMQVAQQYPGVNVNDIMPRGVGSYEKISNQSFLTGVPVTILKMDVRG